MRELNLREYQRSGPFPLSAAERDTLRGQQFSLTIEPAESSDTEYYLRPESVVGAIEIGTLSVLIEPKIGIPKLLSLACYAISKVGLRPEDFDFPEECALPDALALALASHARLAFSKGLLHGYLSEDEALQTVRGRVRFDEQLRRRFDRHLPVEVRYDEFTVDILANRLVKAAAYRLGRMRLRSPEARRNLGWVVGMLDDVSLVEFPPREVPAVAFDRLNEHYKRVVELSRLILRHGAFESGRGPVRASGFLMDMNVVFQEFVTQALREALGVSEHSFCERTIGSLDEGGEVRLRPDLTWWDGASCVFVGDAKYKNLTGERVPNRDLYQMLAYTIALNLPGGLLVYAKGEADTRRYRVRHSGRRLETAALDLSGTLDDVLVRVGKIVQQVIALRDDAGSGPRNYPKTGQVKREGSWRTPWLLSADNYNQNSFPDYIRKSPT